MSTTIQDKIKSCTYCNRFKPKSTNKHETQPWPFAKRPWERVHVDFFQIGKSYFFVLIDAFTKFPEVIPTNDMTGRTVKRILQAMFSRYGIPNCIVSDNGPGLIEKDLEEWFQTIGSRHLTIAPYHPQSNGLAERFVRTMKEQMKDSHFGNHEEIINKFLLCYRNLPHSRTGFTPAQLMFNRPLRTNHTVYSEPQAVWIKDTLKREYEPATVVGKLGNVMKIVKKENGCLAKRHNDQIKLNPQLLPSTLKIGETSELRRSNRNRRKPERYGYV